MLKVGHLIIIAGPSRAGKSCLIEKIREEECPELCEQLGLVDPPSWQFVVARGLKEMRQSTVARLVVHYDLFSQYSKDNEFDGLDEIINQSDRIAVLTLKTSPNLLIERNSLKLRQSIAKIFQTRGPGRRFRALRKVLRVWRRNRCYKRGLSIFLYERWFIYLVEKKIENNWLIVTRKPGALIAYPYVEGY